MLVDTSNNHLSSHVNLLKRIQNMYQTYDKNYKHRQTRPIMTKL